MRVDKSVSDADADVDDASNIAECSGFSIEGLILLPDTNDLRLNVSARLTMSSISKMGTKQKTRIVEFVSLFLIVC